MHIGFSYGKFAEVGRHSFVQLESADTVLFDGQSMSKEALSTPGRGAVGSLLRAIFRIPRWSRIFGGFLLEEDLPHQRVQNSQSRRLLVWRRFLMLVLFHLRL